MCDYCGCRETGPTAELAAEHVVLQDLSAQIERAVAAGDDAVPVFAEFVRLLALHAAKEEVGLFPQARANEVVAESVDQLIAEHDELHRLLADGPDGSGVAQALKLLAQHIDDEEWSLFPHVFHELDPEQWEEIALAHLAVEQVFAEPDGPP